MKFLADEDFDNRILRGIIRRLPELDVVRVQDTEAINKTDPEVLEWADKDDRVLLTHDVNTMTYYFRERLGQGYSSPGIFLVPQSVPIGLVIEELVLIAQYSVDDEYRNQMRFIPLS